MSAENNVTNVTPVTEDKQLRKILEGHRKVAVVGLSAKPDRPSYEIAEFLLHQGYEVVGVNPAVKEVLGRPSYATLAEVPGPLEIVDVFRASEHIPALVDELIPLKPKVLWLQLGVSHAEAEAKARKAGIMVVSDRCILQEHQRLM